MTSPYFTQSGSIITRSRSGSTPAASLKSKLTRRQGDVNAAPPVEVEEEANVSKLEESFTVPSSAGVLALQSRIFHSKETDINDM